MCEAQLCGVKVIMVWRMSLHQVPWMESEPVKKSTDKRENLEDALAAETGRWSLAQRKPTGDVRGSGQREDQGSVQLLRLGRQHRLGVVEEARELRLHFGTPQSGDQPQGRALHAEGGETRRVTQTGRVVFPHLPPTAATLQQ